MMSLWDALRMNMMISYQELVRTFHNTLALSLQDESPGLVPVG
ncbi:ATPase [Escherichia coli]|nr:ATPase [Escherichia coli]MCZ5832036.1 ATPase [Escherichia coli]